MSTLIEKLEDKLNKADAEIDAAFNNLLIIQQELKKSRQNRFISPLIQRKNKKLLRSCKDRFIDAVRHKNAIKNTLEHERKTQQLIELIEEEHAEEVIEAAY